MDSEQIMETLKSIQGNMATKEDIRLLNDGNKKLQDDVNEIKANFKQKVSDLEEKMEGLSRKMEANFNANRARNILIFKVEESLDADENIYVKIKDIFTQVGLVINDLCIETAFRIGKQGGCRPILVRFIAPRWKSLLFKKNKGIRRFGFGNFK